MSSIAYIWGIGLGRGGLEKANGVTGGTNDSKLAVRTTYIELVDDALLRDHRGPVLLEVFGLPGEHPVEPEVVLDRIVLEDLHGRLDTCLLYTSDAADDLLCVDLGGRRIIK